MLPDAAGANMKSKRKSFAAILRAAATDNICSVTAFYARQVENISGT
jgi:hypothetical protein